MDEPAAHLFSIVWDKDGKAIAQVDFDGRTPLELRLDSMLSKLDKIIELLGAKK